MEDEKPDNPIGELVPHMGNTRVTEPIGIAAIALQMALKYHDATVIKDGTMYQQYKMEGRNLRELHMDEVFETAIRVERHLLMSEQRISEMVLDSAKNLLLDIAAEHEDESSPDNPAREGVGDE